MTWPFPASVPDSIKLGREHAVTAEIHYTSGTDSWWYHGRVWLTEMRSIRQRDFDRWLQDHRNRPIVDALAAHPSSSDEEISKLVTPANSMPLPTWIVREVRRALERSDQPHLLRLYGLSGAQKEDERLLVTIDQDLIKEAPMIPYTKTEKGARRTQYWTMGSMVVFYFIFLVASFQVIQNSSAIQYNPGIVTGIAEEWSFPLVCVLLVIGMNLYWSRKTLVLNLEIQPAVENLQDTHTEAVYLVNSEKTPAVTYVSKLLGLSVSAIRDLTEEISRFESDTIWNMQDQTSSMRKQLDQSKVLGVDRFAENLDVAVLTQRGGSNPVGGMSSLTIVLICAIIAVVAAVGTYAAVVGV